MPEEEFTKNADRYTDWPAERMNEIKTNWHNRQVGSKLVSSSSNLRVWHLNLGPGERMPFHRHDCDYFWTVLTDGKSRSYGHDGRVSNEDYHAGDTKHFSIGEGEYFVHDLENIGKTELIFVTVEFFRDDV